MKVTLGLLLLGIAIVTLLFIGNGLRFQEKPRDAEVPSLFEPPEQAKSGITFTLPKDEQQQATDFTSLRRQLPIQTDHFTLEYSYADHALVYTLTQGTRADVERWLQEQGYLAIPADKVVEKRNTQ